MALNLNPTTLAAVVEKAAHDAANHPRWLTAIGRAILELDSNPWIERGELHGLIIGSPSGNAYAANGTCSCLAYTHGQPCWHRAAARLVRLHDEREAAQAYTQVADAGAFGPAFVLNLPDDDQYDAPTMPALGDKLARARKALELVNELY